MQAHPQSSPAARTDRTHSAPPPSRTHTSTPRTRLESTPSRPALASTAGLAHDAGNLLQALGLYSKLLGMPGVLRPEHAHYAAELALISNRSADLIRRLLAMPPAPRATFAQRQQNDALSSSRSHPHPAEILREIAPVLKSAATGIANVSVTCAASLAYVDFPPPVTAEVIERITMNLVRNATEAVQHQHATLSTKSAQGEIKVTFAAIAQRLQLTVDDNGPGMPPAIAAAFLHPSPLPPGASRGLGHRIVHELATSSGGQIFIRVRPGRGTTCTVKWPLLEAVSHSLAPSDSALLS